LTQEKLTANSVGLGDTCPAKYRRDGAVLVCGMLYTEHPSTQPAAGK
jgi:hypothetical protein